MVFANNELRQKLNKLTHWRIFKEMLKQMFHAKVTKGLKKVVLDAPLLFETKVLEHFCYPIIAVYIEDESLQITRLIERNP